jgi:hypothetical protein
MPIMSRCHLLTTSRSSSVFCHGSINQPVEQRRKSEFKAFICSKANSCEWLAADIPGHALLVELRRTTDYAGCMESMTQFNIFDQQGRLLCPACGYPAYSFAPAYLELGGERISICPCCLWEPGYDDADAHTATDVLIALRGYREGWHGSAKWASPSEPPSNWDGERQLSILFDVAPYVR